MQFCTKLVVCLLESSMYAHSQKPIRTNCGRRSVLPWVLVFKAEFVNSGRYSHVGHLSAELTPRKFLTKPLCDGRGSEVFVGSLALA